MGLYLGHKLGVHLFANPEKLKQLNKLKKLIKELKSLRITVRLDTDF
jgi:hypothetical protein